VGYSFSSPHLIVILLQRWRSNFSKKNYKTLKLTTNHKKRKKLLLFKEREREREREKQDKKLKNHKLIKSFYILETKNKKEPRIVLLHK
jgi:hypothetical protein